MNTSRVLIVDDDPDLQLVLRRVFERSKFDVDVVGDGKAAMRAVYEQRFDLVILDLGLPELDGLAVLERIREMADLPVLVLTARGLESDKVTTLLAGADDYLTKPFSNSELIARSVALLRRSGRAAVVPDRIDDGLVTMDLRSREAFVAGQPVTLTPTDWNLMLAFVRSPDEVLSAERLLELAWGDPFGIGTDKVKFAVMRLRRRLGWEDPSDSAIQSIRGVGYRYRPITRDGHIDHP